VKALLENEFVILATQFGFPIAVTTYLLLTRDKVIEGNTKAIQELREILLQMKK